MFSLKVAQIHKNKITREMIKHIESRFKILNKKACFSKSFHRNGGPSSKARNGKAF